MVSRRRKWTKTQPESNRRKKAVRKLANFHAKVAQQRADWQWKLAHQLCKQYSVIKIENLSINGWVALWGRKAFDLAIGSFITKLEFIASKYGTEIIKVDRFYASSHICSCCGHKLERKLGLNEREWECPACGRALGRDVNAAVNIEHWDASVQREKPRDMEQRITRKHRSKTTRRKACAA